MKWIQGIVAVLSVALVSADEPATKTPMAKVVELLTQLEAKIESDGKAEQKSYDKYACWCEETLGRKATDISKAKELIDETESLIKKLKAEISSHGAEIKQLKKDIAANIEGQREATEMRDKDYEDFQKGKLENEQCTGALEAAIKVLTGAGEGNFLEKKKSEMLQEAQLMSVVSGVRSVLKTNHAKTMESKDLDLIKRFVDHPEDFMGNRAAMVSAAQISNNPFGDYAPQSTQIQGILKGMYDAFTMDIEKDNAEEADSQKSHEALIATKQAELKTLEETLETQELEEAQKSKKLADSQTILDDTKTQLKADEKFFEETKDTCKVKARDWANRSRMRTEELQGMAKAIQILSEGEDTFKAATTTFLQLSQAKADPSKKAYKTISALARKFNNLEFAQLAVALEHTQGSKTGGHFDKVMMSIDKMIALLREEEAEDIAHRDRCERAQNKNANNMADAEHQMKKSGAAIERLQGEASDLNDKIKELELAIKDTKGDMSDLLDMRNQALGEFKQAVKDDTDAIALLDQAIAALSAFYKKNKLDMSLAQKEDPSYSADEDKAPTLSYEGTRTDGGVSGGSSYGGRTGETGGIVAILGMLKEDLEKEIKVGVQENAEAEEEYEKQKGALKGTLDSQMQTKISTEKELMEVDKKIDDINTFKDQQGTDLGDEAKLAESIEKDCGWVKTHFESRREKRKAEMDGLEEAKSYLAGVDEYR